MKGFKTKLKEITRRFDEGERDVVEQPKVNE